MRKWEEILAAVAVIAVVIYSLACRPAWHPSGKSVAFPFAIEVTTQAGDETISGVAIYDVETGEVKRIFEEKNEAFAMGHVLWTGDGKAIVAAVPGESGEEYRVLRIDPATGKAELTATITDIENATVMNPPVLGGNGVLWLGTFTKKGEEKEGSTGDSRGSYMRVDLADGKVTEGFTSTDSILGLYDFGKRGCYYVKATGEKQGEVLSVIIGRFDADTGALEEMATLPAGVYGECGYMTAEPGGSRFAILAGTGDEELFVRVFDEKGHVLKDIAIDMKLTTGTGALAWIGDSVWIGAKREASMEDFFESGLGFLVIGVDSEKSRFVPLGKGGSSEDLWTLQPALSPDGKTVAVSGLKLESAKVKGRIALVLLDAAAPEREPKYIPLPLESGEKLKEEKEVSSTDAVLRLPGETTSGLTVATREAAAEAAK